MRPPRLALVLSSALITLSVATAFGQIQGTSAPDAVEEDWQLVIASPDPYSIGPQITSVMSPVSDGSTPFFAFDMNYREYPFFSAGGMQVQVWSNGSVTDTSSHGSALLNTVGEVITWTQRMSLSGGTVSYNVTNGQSTTWGRFGRKTQFGASFQAGVNDLSGYDPDVSAANSGVSWQSNHVTQLVLFQVRYYARGQLISTDTNPRTLIAPAGITARPVIRRQKTHRRTDR